MWTERRVPHFIDAQQWQATDTDRYSIAPQRTQPFASLPQPNFTFAFGRKPNEPDPRFPATCRTDHSS